MPRFFLAAAVVTSCFGFVTQALAWGGDGHRIVCAMAWDEVSPAVQHKIEDLLDVHGRAEFAETCLWADEYRDQGHPETKPWHYVNVPRGATAADFARDCPEPQSCVLTQIDRDAAQLQGTASREDKAMALKFLGHFVADLHQPLHVSHDDDERGGDIKGDFLGQPYDFHWLWDNGLIVATNIPWVDQVKRLEATVTPAQRRQWTDSKPIDWANESLAIANDPAIEYADHPFHLGGDYQAHQLPIIYARLTRAGVRLGALLTRALGAP